MTCWITEIMLQILGRILTRKHPFINIFNKVFHSEKAMAKASEWLNNENTSLFFVINTKNELVLSLVQILIIGNKWIKT